MADDDDDDGGGGGGGGGVERIRKEYLVLTYSPLYIYIYICTYSLTFLSSWGKFRCSFFQLFNINKSYNKDRTLTLVFFFPPWRLVGIGKT
jgi:hypothetical protein